MPGKISILKESGESVNSNVVSVFMVPDTQKKYLISTENTVDPHGLTILHVSEIVGGSLQKVASDEEWSSIKTIMRAIISGNVGSYQYLQPIDSAKSADIYSRDISVSATAAKQMSDNYEARDKENTPTVDAAGVVTVVGYGMAEITAEVAENETYLASKATFKLFVIEGNGTLQNAYTVADVLYFYGKVTDKVWVKGTICGSLSKTNELTTDPAAVQASNLAIGTAETFLPVQLSSKTAPRENLNLLDNPDMLGQTVWVYGNIEKYFSMPGVKSVTDFSFDGVTGIDAVETETAAKGIYLLDGRRVQQPVKGINIINGKKVVVK
jgi:hypothetical protein